MGQTDDFDCYAHLVRPIATSVARRLPPSFALDDLMQTGNMALICALGARDPQMSEAQWLAYVRMCIRGAMIDSAKGVAYLESQHQEIEAARDVPDPATPIDERLDTVSQRRRAWLLIDALPPELRRVMRCRYMAVGVELMTQAQTAVHIGISQATVSNYERRAIAWIREQLNAGAGGAAAAAQRDDKAA